MENPKPMENGKLSSKDFVSAIEKEYPNPMENTREPLSPKQWLPTYLKGKDTVDLINLWFYYVTK
jgi:hypothetical protein